MPASQRVLKSEGAPENVLAVPGGDGEFAQPEIVGRSPALLAALEVLRRLSLCDLPVLLCGETGTGKELAARTIHYQSARCGRPFIPVNCGAIPEQLVESELFGHAQGAFTDARNAQIGLVAQANGGTLFLDEVDALGLKAQVALLRFLEDGSFRPLGARQFLRSHSRIIAATNAEIIDLVKRGAFRSDLYFRLATAPVLLPPLRERQGDMRLLVETFLRDLALQHGGGPRWMDEASLQRLERYHWPGNVRELANVIQRTFLLSESRCLTAPADALAMIDVPCDDGGNTASTMPSSFKIARAQVLAEFERHFVRRALTESSGNVSLAAKRAGKERRSFGRLLKKHGINRAEFTSAP